jgi:hypothetical protein
MGYAGRSLGGVIMPTLGSQDRRFGKLGDSRRRDGGHVAGVHIGKGGSQAASLKRRDSDIDLRSPEEPYRSSNVPVAGEPRGVVEDKRR